MEDIKDYRDKEFIEIKKKAGVSKLKCGSCEKINIGRTGRTFKERVYKHSHSYHLNYENSNYANHFSDNTDPI